MNDPINIVTAVLAAVVALGFCAGWIVSGIFRAGSHRDDVEEAYWEGMDGGRESALKEARSAQNKRCEKCIAALPKCLPIPPPKTEGEAA